MRLDWKLTDCCACGYCSDEWSVLRRLFYLDMGNTGLNGHLPRSWSVLTGMNVL